MTEIAGYSQGPVAAPVTAPAVDLMSNQDFVFPPMESSRSHRRMKSMGAAAPRPIENAHRRGASALPSFTFNANDTSGFTGDESDDEPAEDAVPAPATPSRGSHKRNTSEYVGGLGMTGAISSSPTRSSALSVPRRQHRYGHSRSQLTLSSHDLNSIMSPPEPQPRLSSSLPTTPLEHPNLQSLGGPAASADGSFGSAVDNASARPPSRPRVGFSENVEYIPRPLSTISSETGSSMSTVRGHSVNNSISSVLSSSTQGSPYSRVRAKSLGMTLEDEPRYALKSSLEVSRRIEKEGQWLRNGSVGDGQARPFTQPASPPPRLTFADGHLTAQPRVPHHRKQRSISNGFGFDRRKSEPAMGLHADHPSRLSAISLQEQVANAPYLAEDALTETDRRSSSRKLKDWAVSKLLARRSKEIVRPVSAHTPMSAPHLVPTPNLVDANPAVAETDLDAVFAMDAPEPSGTTARAHPVFDVGPPYFAANTSSRFDQYEEHGTMLDLDAALGPFNTPQLSMQRPRRELHSSRGTKDFVGPGGHYLPSISHRRTESAPMLTAFEQGRIGTPPLAPMADVFEEDEEDLDAAIPQKSLFGAQLVSDDEAGTGVQIVDSDISANSSTPSLSLDDGLRIQRGDWEPERPSTSYATLGSRLSTPLMDRRSSIIEDTIIEESSPTEPTIVAFHEEPRAQSLTKSSDSSETPTILASQSSLLALPTEELQSETPDTCQSSAFSSPDMMRRQSSFDTSRVGTSASSITDNRTMSSCMTGEPPQEVRVSSDDVPSLTSSRSTMISTMHANTSRRDVSGMRTPSSSNLGSTAASNARRKRASIQSLSQLVGGSFGPRSTGSDSRPQTASSPEGNSGPKKKEHRLKKLMFWKSKSRQASASTVGSSTTT